MYTLHVKHHNKDARQGAPALLFKPSIIMVASYVIRFQIPSAPIICLTATLKSSKCKLLKEPSSSFFFLNKFAYHNTSNTVK